MESRLNIFKIMQQFLQDYIEKMDRDSNPIKTYPEYISHVNRLDAKVKKPTEEIIARDQRQQDNAQEAFYISSESLLGRERARLLIKY